jgi:hypothetical protein
MFKSSPIKASEPVFVSVSEWQGKQRFDIRHYYSTEVTDDETMRIDLRPGTKGINVPIEDASAVISAVLTVVEIANAAGRVGGISVGARVAVLAAAGLAGRLPGHQFRSPRPHQTHFL